MKTTIYALALISGTMGAVAGRTGAEFAIGVPHAVPPDFRGMVVAELDYDPTKKMVFQKVHSVTKDPIRASWSAKITRNGEIVCVGGGIAPYEGVNNAERIYFKPVDWAGNTPGGLCPEALKSGDVLIANWEHRDGSGLTRSVSKRLVLDLPPDAN